MRAQKDVDTIGHWKRFHDEIGTVLGCEFREVSVTLAAAKKLVERQRKIAELTDDLDKSGDEIVGEIREILNL